MFYLIFHYSILCMNSHMCRIPKIDLNKNVPPKPFMCLFIIQTT